MTSRTRRGLAAAALCSAGLLVAGAPLIATAHNNGKKGDPPGKNHKKPAYGQPGFKPGKPGSATLFAKLIGKNEISTTTGKKRAGDPDGQGGATITITKTNTLCFGIVVQGITTPNAAHVHQGKRGKNGNIVIPLTQPATGDPGASSGCVPNLDTGLLSDIRKHPSRYYVNVHTNDFPNGALRGQLGKAWGWH
jgi:hypothetical protein